MVTNIDDSLYCSLKYFVAFDEIHSQNVFYTTQNVTCILSSFQKCVPISLGELACELCSELLTFLEPLHPVADDKGVVLFIFNAPR